MARVTVEDCVVKIPNRFELVLLAGQRARDLSAGVSPTIEKENDKHPVIALREIAAETIGLDELRHAMVYGLQKHVEVDEPEDDNMTLIAAAESEWGASQLGAGEANNNASESADVGDIANSEVADSEVADTEVSDTAVETEEIGGEDSTEWSDNVAPSDEVIKNLGESVIEDPADLPGDET